jgi:hypothetical protein
MYDKISVLNFTFDLRPWTVQRVSDSKNKAKALRKDRNLTLETTAKIMSTLDEGCKTLPIKFKDRHGWGRQSNCLFSCNKVLLKESILFHQEKQFSLIL